MYFKELKNDQAVKIGDSYVVRLSQGNYLSPEGLNVESGYGDQHTVSSIEGWKRVVKTPAKIIKYIFEDGSEHTPEEYTTIVSENGKYWNDVLEEHEYPDIDTEFEIKKELDKFNRAEKVLGEVEVKHNAVDIQLVGCSKDSGSKFIKSPILFGSLTWHGQGVWKVEQGAIAKDEFLSCTSDHVADIPNHSNIEYAKINGGFVFTKEKHRWIKQHDATKIFDNLEDAKKEEECIRRFVRKLCEMHTNPKGADKLTLKKLYREVASIEEAVVNISAKQVSSSQKITAVRKIGDLKKMLLDD